MTAMMKSSRMPELRFQVPYYAQASLGKAAPGDTPIAQIPKDIA